MRKLRALVILAVALTVHSNAQATPWTGNALLEDCQETVNVLDRISSTPPAIATASVRACFSFIKGVIDSTTIFNGVMERGGLPLVFFCVPDEVSLGQLARVAVDELRKRPARLHEPQSTLLIEVLGDTFPCQQ